MIARRMSVDEGEAPGSHMLSLSMDLGAGAFVLYGFYLCPKCQRRACLNCARAHCGACGTLLGRRSVAPYKESPGACDTCGQTCAIASASSGPAGCPKPPARQSESRGSAGRPRLTALNPLVPPSPPKRSGGGDPAPQWGPGGPAKSPGGRPDSGAGVPPRERRGSLQPSAQEQKARMHGIIAKQRASRRLRAEHEEEDRAHAEAVARLDGLLHETPESAAAEAERLEQQLADARAAHADRVRARAAALREVELTADEFCFLKGQQALRAQRRVSKALLEQHPEWGARRGSAHAEPPPPEEEVRLQEETEQVIAAAAVGVRALLPRLWPSADLLPPAVAGPCLVHESLGPNPPPPRSKDALPPPPPVDTTKTRSGPRRVRMSSGERPMGAARGTMQSDTEALCQPPPPPTCTTAGLVQVLRSRHPVPFLSTNGPVSRRLWLQRPSVA